MVYLDVYSNPKKYPLQQGGCPILNTTIEADDTHPGLRALAGEALKNWKDRLVQLIRGGIANKEILPHAEQAALTIIALLEGNILITRSTGNAAFSPAW